LTKRTERTWTQTTYSAVLDSFPSDSKIWLAYPPVIEDSVSVEYYTGIGNAMATFDDFHLVSRDNEAFITLDDGSSWPLPATRPDAVTITYIAGKQQADVPAAARHAVRLLIGQWFNNREASGPVQQKVEHALDALIGTLKSGRTGGGYAC
jgi:uncharacterized phiE125 gp8 family phage protein